MNRQYPIGKSMFNPHYSEESLHSAVSYLEGFPHILSERLAEISKASLGNTYRLGGWNIAQIVHHLADSHSNALIRFKWTLTENEPTIKAYNEKAWAELPDAQNDNLEPSLQMLKGIHSRLVALLRGLEGHSYKRRFYHPESNEWVCLDQLLFQYEWHSKHHLKHIDIAINDPQ